jgi:hypothetical protein
LNRIDVRTVLRQGGMGVLENLLGNVGDTEASCGKVWVLELCESLDVEFGFELIEGVGEF